MGDKAVGALFKNRSEAAARLLPAIRQALGKGVQPVIIALPRGGVPLGALIADGLAAPLDVVLVRKIGFPGQPELAVAAITDGAQPSLAVNREIAAQGGLSHADIMARAQPALAEIARRRALWLGGRAPAALAGRTIVVVDDGIATGASMRAALACLRLHDVGRIIVAIPLAPAEVLATIAPLADQIICLETPCPFLAVGAHYADFPQIDDATVAAMLKAQSRAADRPPP